MKKIKFRAWDKKTKDIFSVDKLMLHPNVGMVMCATCGLYIGLAQGSDYVLMQSTGLLDKNGKEIFEGDILRTPHFLDADGWQYLYHVVEWSGKFCGWFAKNPRSGVDNDGSLQLWVYAKNEDYVVCGNIYETPELLTK